MTGRAAVRRAPGSRLLGVVMLGIGAFLLLPLLNLVLWAFAGRWFYPSLLPQAWSLQWFRYVFSQGHLTHAIVLSLTFAPIVTLVACFVCLPAAYAFGRFDFFARRSLMIGILATNAFPRFGLYIGLATILYGLNLVDTALGVVIVQLLGTLVPMTWIAAAAFGGVPRELEQAARDAGAGPMRTFARITLPVAAPGVLVAVILAFLAAFDEAQGTFLVGMPRYQTMPIMMYSIVAGYPEPAAAVFSMVLATPSFILLLLVRRYIIGGSIAAGFSLL